MLNFLMSAGWKRATQKLNDIGMGEGGSSNVTLFRNLATLVTSDISKGHHIDYFIEAMNKATKPPDLLLKQTILIHIYLQERTYINVEKLT